MQGVWVQSLIRELRSWQAKKIKKKKKSLYLSFVSPGHFIFPNLLTILMTLFNDFTLIAELRLDPCLPKAKT